MSDTNQGGMPPAVPKPPAAPNEKTTKVRLLVDCDHGKANAVVVLPASAAAAAVKAGVADDTKASVVYAESLKPVKPVEQE